MAWQSLLVIFKNSTGIWWAGANKTYRNATWRAKMNYALLWMLWFDEKSISNVGTWLHVFVLKQRSYILRKYAIAICMCGHYNYLQQGRRALFWQQEMNLEKPCREITVLWNWWRNVPLDKKNPYMFILDFELITSEHTQCSIDALFPFPYINAFFRTNVQKYNIYILPLKINQFKFTN